MRTVDVSIVISRPPERVFDYMLDFSNTTKWRSLVTHMEVIGGGPPRAGAKLKVKLWAEGKELEQVIDLPVLERPALYITVGDSQGFRLEIRNELTPVPDGTRVRVTGDTTAHSLGGKLMLPLLRRKHRQRFGKVLEKLKLAIEAEP